MHKSHDTPPKVGKAKATRATIREVRKLLKTGARFLVAARFFWETAGPDLMNFF